MPGAERTRVEGFGQLENGLRQASDWYLWGPYLSERQWGTVREDYSADGDAWSYLPHDHARSRAYRWGEDGMAGFSRRRAAAVPRRWRCGTAAIPILKERMFGLTGAQANHGEDVKEYWWYLDAVPSHAWNRWRYHYPQAAFPYDDLIAENGRRGKLDPEYELLDTGVFDEDRYWIVEVDYAKADPDRPAHDGPGHQRRARTPRRCTCCRRPGSATRGAGTSTPPKPRLLARADGAIAIDHPFLGDLELLAGPGPDGTAPTALFCENETNDAPAVRLASQPAVPEGRDQRPRRARARPPSTPSTHGTKVALWYQLAVEPGATVELRLRLRPAGAKPAKADERARRRLRRGRRPAPAGGRRVLRRADPGPGHVRRRPWSCARPSPGCCGASSCTPTTCAAGWRATRRSRRRRPTGWTERNSRWKNFDAFDIMSMPDKWEYPWFAAWDLAFHCVALAHVDPAFAKYQLLLLCREWFQHPNGALPAYEWDFGDVNPPVQAWAALEVFAIDGGRDLDFLSRIFDKLLVNFTWWVNLEDADGSNLFEGGFLGLDNIGPLDRSHLPVGGALEQSDATGWMALLRAGDGRHRRASSTARASGRPTTSCSSSSSTSPRSARPWPRSACGTTRTASTTTSWSRPTAPSCR